MRVIHFQIFWDTIKEINKIRQQNLTEQAVGAYVVPEPELGHYSQLVKGPASAMSRSSISDRKLNTQVTLTTLGQETHSSWAGVNSNRGSTVCLCTL